MLSPVAVGTRMWVALGEIYLLLLSVNSATLKSSVKGYHLSRQGGAKNPEQRHLHTGEARWVHSNRVADLVPAVSLR